jgi:hypothetical protein
MQLAELLSLVANHQGLISTAPSKSERPKGANSAPGAAGASARTAGPAKGASTHAAIT